jgi:hypothetical protein
LRFYILARYFVRQITEFRRHILAVRSEIETRSKTADADMGAALPHK